MSPACVTMIVIMARTTAPVPLKVRRYQFTSSIKTLSDPNCSQGGDFIPRIFLWRSQLEVGVVLVLAKPHMARLAGHRGRCGSGISPPSAIGRSFWHI